MGDARWAVRIDIDQFYPGCRARVVDGLHVFERSEQSEVFLVPDSEEEVPAAATALANDAG